MYSATSDTNILKAQRLCVLSEAWKLRDGYIADIKHPYLYNSWRAMMFTLKGKSIGVDSSWHSYRAFYNDVMPSYKEGLRYARIDKEKPFGPSNFIWVSEDVAGLLKTKVRIEYNGEVKTIKEWSNDLGLSEYGIKLRYHRCKHYTNEEILFGKKKLKRKPKHDAAALAYQKLRNKASRMCSSYRIKDQRKGLATDITPEWLIDHILFKECHYCGSQEFIGCDRINNQTGHVKANVIPCCHVCNTARGDNFSMEEMEIIGKTITRVNNMRKTHNT